MTWPSINSSSVIKKTPNFWSLLYCKQYFSMEINETIKIFLKRLISQLLAILFYDLFLTLPYCTISTLCKKQGDLPIKSVTE